jgi:hypothetical protein
MCRVSLAVDGVGGRIANGCRLVYSVYAYDGAEEEGHAWEAGEEERVNTERPSIRTSMRQTVSG